MAKREKPATAGEKIVMAAHKWPSPEPVRSWPITHRTAKAIDRTIARAVKKERQRCVWCACRFGAMDEAISAMKEGRLHP